MNKKKKLKINFSELDWNEKSDALFSSKNSYYDPNFSRNYNAVYQREDYGNLKTTSDLKLFDLENYHSSKLYDLEVAIDTEYVSGFEHGINKTNISLQMAVIGHNHPQFKESPNEQGYFFINDSESTKSIKNRMTTGKSDFMKHWTREFTTYNTGIINFNPNIKIATYNENDKGSEAPLIRVLNDTIPENIIHESQLKKTAGKFKHFKVLLTGYFLTVDLQVAISGTGIENIYELVESKRRLTVNRDEIEKFSNSIPKKNFLETDLYFQRGKELYRIVLDLRDGSGVAPSLKGLIQQAGMDTSTKTSLDNYKSCMDVGFIKHTHEFIKYGISDAVDSYRALVDYKKTIIKFLLNVDPDTDVAQRRFIILKTKIIDIDAGSLNNLINIMAEDYGLLPETGGAIDNLVFENSLLDHINRILTNEGFKDLHTSLKWFKDVAKSVIRSLNHNRNKDFLYRSEKDEATGKYKLVKQDSSNNVDTYLNITQGGRFMNRNPIGNDLSEAITLASGLANKKDYRLTGIIMDQDISACYGKGMSNTNIYLGDAGVKYSIHSPEHQNNVVLQKLLNKRTYKLFMRDFIKNDGITLQMFYDYFLSKGVFPLEGWLAVISTKELLDFDQLFFVSKPKSKSCDHLSEKTIEDNFIDLNDTLKSISNNATSVFTRQITNSVINEGCVELIDSMQGERRKDFFSKVYITAFETYLKPNNNLYIKELLGSIIKMNEIEYNDLKYKLDEMIEKYAELEKSPPEVYVNRYEREMEEALNNIDSITEELIDFYDREGKNSKYYKTHVSLFINANITTTLGKLVVDELVAKRKHYKSLGKAHPDYYHQGNLKLFINTLYGIQASGYFTASNAIVGNNITMKPRVLTFLMETSTFSGSTITDGAMFRVDIFPDMEKIKEIMGETFNPWSLQPTIKINDEGKVIYEYPKIISTYDTKGNYHQYDFPLTNKMLGYEVLELIDHGKIVLGNEKIDFQTIIIREPDGKEVYYSDLTYMDYVLGEESNNYRTLCESIDQKYVHIIGNKDCKSITDFDKTMMDYFKSHWGPLMNPEIYDYSLERKMYFKTGEETMQGGGDYKIRDIARKRGSESKKTFMDHNSNIYEDNPTTELFKNIRNENGDLNRYVKLPVWKIKNGIAKPGYLKSRSKNRLKNVNLGDGIAILESGHFAPAAIKFQNEEVDLMVKKSLDNIHKDYGIGRAGFALKLVEGELCIDRLKMNNVMGKLSECTKEGEVKRIFANLRKSIMKYLKTPEYADYLEDVVIKDQAVCEFNGLKRDLKKWSRGKKIVDNVRSIITT